MFYGGGRDDGNGNSGRGGIRNRSDRYEQMTKQQQLIEFKKQEIQKRLEEERHKKTMETLLMGTKSSSSSSTSGSSSSSSSSSPAPASSRQNSSRPIKSEEAKSIPFANDGSFLERFKKLQEQELEKKKSAEIKVAKEDNNEYGSGRPQGQPSIKIFDPNSAPNPHMNPAPAVNHSDRNSVHHGGHYNNSRDNDSGRGSNSGQFGPPKFYGGPPPPPPPPPPPQSAPRGKQSPPMQQQQYRGFGYQNAPPPPPPPPPPIQRPTGNPYQQNQHSQSQSYPPPPPPVSNEPKPSGFPSEKVKQLAADVADGGPTVEDSARIKYKDDPMFWFLFRPDSAEYGRYRDLVTHLKFENMPDPPKQVYPPMEFQGNRYGDVAQFQQPNIKRPAPSEEDDDEGNRKRRSRWGPQSGGAVPPPTVANFSPGQPQPLMGIKSEDGPPPPPMPISYPIGGIKQDRDAGPFPLGGIKSEYGGGPMNFGPGPGINVPPPGLIGNNFSPNVNLNLKGPPPMLTRVTRTNPQLLSYAKQSYGTVDLDDEQWKQCEEAYKMNLLFQDIARKKAKDEQTAMAGKFKHEYDSDEDDEGGTWEHKQRMKEMEKTRDWAQELTHKAKGKHHIGDFLPPDQLEKFMDKYKAVKEGRQMDESAYQDFKIAQDNVGFKLLQKMGWNDGQGLGSTGQGITAPIDKGVGVSDKQGLGIEKPSELREEDDEYAAYRKRMMLAYRFRPNPLNNPRRAYY